MREQTMGGAARQNVRGWRLARMPVRPSARPVTKPPVPLSVQVHHWTLVLVCLIVLTFFGGIFYLDHLTGYWLGAVMGRLALVSVLIVVLGACVMGPAAGPKR